MFEAKLLEFLPRGDERGYLVAIEENKEIPFQIKRVFYIYGTKYNVKRGQHANLNSEFVLINIAGKSKVKIDDGNESKIFELNRPHTGIYIPRMYWKEMYDFSDDAILLCLASEYYDDGEYIRDYFKFKKIKGDYFAL